jgi:hypothetical protein
MMANIIIKSSCCFWKCNRNSGHRFSTMVCWDFGLIVMYLFTSHCWELMKSVSSHGSLSQLFMKKVMVWHFVNDSHELMTALIVVTPSNCCGDFCCNFRDDWLACVEWCPLSEVSKANFCGRAWMLSSLLWIEYAVFCCGHQCGALSVFDNFDHL